MSAQVSLNDMDVRLVRRAIFEQKLTMLSIVNVQSSSGVPVSVNQRLLTQSHKNVQVT